MSHAPQRALRRRAPSVAVVGGGVFGATAAIELANRGFQVDLFERRNDLLQAASGINQYRLHRGYHYPRSLATAIECRDSEQTFRDAFGKAVVDSEEHYYAISSHDSLTTAEDYARFLEQTGLEHTPTSLDLIRETSVSTVLRVRESLFDADVLRAVLWRGLREAGVRVHTGVAASGSILDRFDLSVIATYAELNRLTARSPRVYQFEVCEKPVVKLPREYSGRSVVVMDGPFMCVDPLPGSPFHVLGNVVHAIHHTNIGAFPEVPDELRDHLNRGVVRSPRVTKIGDFVTSAATFFRNFEQAEHIGSMFTVRAVLPAVEDTDARPTVIQQLDDRTISIFSGKIDTCIRAADEVGTLAEAALRWTDLHEQAV
jgi:hypothetical protein